MKISALLSLIACSALFVGCASVPMASATQDSAAKQFVVEPGKANIYVNRGGGIGTALVFQTVLDGRIVGSLAPNTYQLLVVSPGEHTVTLTGNENAQQQTLTAEAGKNYFFKVSVHMGWIAGRVHIEPISEEQGRAELMSSERAETTSYQ
jgi:Protein of unknown function (DUF2846)